MWITLQILPIFIGLFPRNALPGNMKWGYKSLFFIVTIQGERPINPVAWVFTLVKYCSFKFSTSIIEKVGLARGLLVSFLSFTSDYLVKVQLSYHRNVPCWVLGNFLPDLSFGWDYHRLRDGVIKDLPLGILRFSSCQLFSTNRTALRFNEKQ